MKNLSSTHKWNNFFIRFYLSLDWTPDYQNHFLLKIICILIKCVLVQSKFDSWVEQFLIRLTLQPDFELSRSRYNGNGMVILFYLTFWQLSLSYSRYVFILSLLFSLYCFWPIIREKNKVVMKVVRKICTNIITYNYIYGEKGKVIYGVQNNDYY